MYHIYWGSAGQDKRVINRKRQGGTFYSKTGLPLMVAEGKEEDWGGRASDSSTGPGKFQPGLCEAHGQSGLFQGSRVL